MSAYKNIIIYCFSGTGNSVNVGSWIRSVAEADNTPCQIINIADADRLNIPAPAPDSLVVFVSPIHGFNYPPVMLNFLCRFPRGRNKAVLMNTRAGMLIGKWVTPGLTGIAFYFAAILLLLKGYSIKAMFPVDMPSNWISVHPGLNKRTVEYLHLRNKERVIKFSKIILSGGSNFKALREILQDMAIAPVSLLYYFLGRFLIAKTYYASNACNNCNICMNNCPVKAIKRIDGRLFWTFSCESCMKCMSNCPKHAIETAHGFIFFLYIIIYPAATALFYQLATKFLPFVRNEYCKFLLDSLIFLLILAVAYRALHLLLRFSFIEKLIVYTSLTKYKFWGRRYKSLKNY